MTAYIVYFKIYYTFILFLYTEEDFELRKMILPCPVPAVTPAPMMMYSNPVPYPVLLPVPIPIPVFIPTTKKSTAGIMRKIKVLKFLF